MNQRTPTLIDQIPLTRAEYYPPEAEVGETEIAEIVLGIHDMRATWVDVTPCVYDYDQVTVGARGDIDGDPINYEMDLTPDGARRLARRLEEAAAAAERPQPVPEVRP